MNWCIVIEAAEKGQHDKCDNSSNKDLSDSPDNLLHLYDFITSAKRPKMFVDRAYVILLVKAEMR